MIFTRLIMDLVCLCFVGCQHKTMEQSAFEDWQDSEPIDKYTDTERTYPHKMVLLEADQIGSKHYFDKVKAWFDDLTRAEQEAYARYNFVQSDAFRMADDLTRKQFLEAVKTVTPLMIRRGKSD